jgi:hypothetical protein
MTRLSGVPVVGRTERQLRLLSDTDLNAELTITTIEVDKFQLALAEHMAMWARERNLSTATKRKRRNVEKSYRRMIRAWVDARARVREVQRERREAAKFERAMRRRLVEPMPVATTCEDLRAARGERLLATVVGNTRQQYQRCIALVAEERRRKAPDYALLVVLHAMAEGLRADVKGARSRGPAA